MDPKYIILKLEEVLRTADQEDQGHIGFDRKQPSDSAHCMFDCFDALVIEYIWSYLGVFLPFLLLRNEVCFL